MLKNLELHAKFHQVVLPLFTLFTCLFPQIDIKTRIRNLNHYTTKAVQKVSNQGAVQFLQG